MMSEEHEDYRRLLNDVLHDEDYRAFREGLRRRVVQHLRRRRPRRRLLRIALTAAVAAILALIPMLLARLAATGNDPSEEPAPSHVAQRPTVAPGAPASPDASSHRIARAEHEHAGVQIISDVELLALLKGRPCALVQTEGGRRRLWVYDSAKQAWASGGDITLSAASDPAPPDSGAQSGAPPS